MRRIPIQLDDKTYAALKRRAAQQGRSIAAIVRESLGRYVDDRALTSGDFTFVGSGRNASDRKQRTSERHDDALAEAIAPRRKKR